MNDASALARSRNVVKSVMCVAAAVLLISSATSAQADDDDRAIVRGGLSPTTFGGTFAGTVSASLGSEGKLLYTARLTKTGEFSWSETATNSEFGLLVGARRSQGPFSMSVSAGLGANHAFRPRRSDRRGLSSVDPGVDGYLLGVPLEAALTVGNGNFGVGVVALGHLSPKASFGAVALVIEIGHRR
jgi:hypothetical protein